MIDLSVLSGTENGIGSLSLGFKLIHDKIMRIAANLFADGSFGDGGFIISFESSKYSFNLHLTNSLANMDTFTRDGRTIQIGATYRMSQEGNPTLLNRKY